MIWTFCSARSVGHPSKNYQNTFIETKRESIGPYTFVSGHSILHPVFLFLLTSSTLFPSYNVKDCKEMNDCKKCKWGLRLVLGKCQGKHFFTEITK